jgi:hypothetical protein
MRRPRGNPRGAFELAAGRCRLDPGRPLDDLSFTFIQLAIGA